MNAIKHAFQGKDKGIYSINDSVKNKDQIFNPFFTMKRGHGGIGLGLSIVYNIVIQNLKGTIEVQSELGKGCEFIIKIPL